MALFAALVAGTGYVVLNGGGEAPDPAAPRAKSAGESAVPEQVGAGGAAPAAAVEPGAEGSERPAMGFAGLPAEHQPEAMRRLGGKLAAWFQSHAGGIGANMTGVDCRSAPCVVNAVLTGEGVNDVRDRAVDHVTKQASFATPRNVVIFDDPKTGKQHVWLFWPPVAPDDPRYVDYLVDASIRAKAARDELEATGKGAEAGRGGAAE